MPSWNVAAIHRGEVPESPVDLRGRRAGIELEENPVDFRIDERRVRGVHPAGNIVLVAATVHSMHPRLACPRGQAKVILPPIFGGRDPENVNSWHVRPLPGPLRS